MNDIIISDANVVEEISDWHINHLSGHDHGTPTHIILYGRR